MKNIFYLSLSMVLLFFPLSGFARFGALDNMELYIAKNDSFTLYVDNIFAANQASKSITSAVSFPKGWQFMGNKLSGNYRSGYKFLISRQYNIAGYAKESEIVKLPLPTDRYDLFQLLLDDYNQIQRASIGGTFAALAGRNADQLTLEVYVHEIFLKADIAEKQQYAKQMYRLWQECNPSVEHLVVNFVKRSIGSKDEIILKIKDNFVASKPNVPMLGKL